MRKPYPLLAAGIAALCFVHWPATTRADDDEAAELKQQPEAVQHTAHREIGAAEITEVEPTFEEGMHATEVEYTENGKKMAVVIAPDGALIQKEHRMSPADAPAAISKAVAAQFPGGVISHIKEIERHGRRFFELSVKSGGKAHRVKMDAGGRVIGGE